MSTPAEQLKAARALIADPAHWCRGDYAKDERGCGVPFNDPRAVQHCAEGAAMYVCRSAKAPVRAVLLRASIALYHTSTTWTNDHRGHSAVLAIYDKAIAEAEASEAQT